MRVPIGDFELQNIVREGDALRTRAGLQSVKTPTSGTAFVGSFTIESPNTTEPWHYLVEQSTTTGVCMLRVFTEEFFELYNVDLGPMQQSPVITYGVQLNQIMINSPSFAGAQYGLVGGGVVTATKAASIDPGTTALDIPVGHVAAFGDRLPIAVGSLMYHNDPGIDPRTYVAENVVAFAGSIYDHMQGLDGGHYVFTSAGVYVMAADALGQGQSVTGFISRVPGLETTRSRNAAASNGQIGVMQKDGIQIINGPHIPIVRSRARRYWARVVDVEDLRVSGQIFGTPRGFVVGFNSRRGFFLDVDLKTQSFSWVTSTSSALNVVGTLRSRDGELLVVLRDRVVLPYGNADFDSATVQGIAAGRLDLPEDQRVVVRRVTVSASNVGQTVGAAVNGNIATATSPTKSTDTIIGTSTWSASAKISGRVTRTARLSVVAPATDPHIEVRVDGADRRVEPFIDVEITGQRRGRRDID
jgi:hypothetical protein